MSASPALRLVHSAPSPLDGALMMAKLGFSVIRLRPGTKVPVVGPKEATTDAGVIQGWVLWGEVPDCNFGYLLGPNHVGIDFDLYKPGGREARAQFGEIPRTLQFFTPGGGEHYVLKISRQIGQQKPAPTIDVRTGAGYLVCPGSTVGGKPYVLGDDAPPAVCPPHIDSRLGKRLELPDRAAEWVSGTCGDWAGKIPADVWARIRSEGPDRSKHCFEVLQDLFNLGLTDDDVQEVAELEDASFALKYLDRGDLEREISDVRREWKMVQAAKLAPFQEVRQPPTAASITTWRSHVLRAADLEHREFQPVRWVVPGIVPEGLSMLAGRPKLGKSWLALDMVVAGTTGGECLGIRMPPGDCLYLALEDNQRRLQRRMRRLKLNGWPERLTLATQWRRLDQGGVADIAEWADSVAKPTLVVIDTFAAVKPVAKTKGYEEDYASLTPLHRMAGERGLAVLVLHHQRKQGADDPLDSISGTLGIAGCIDTPIVLARGAKGTTLYVRGRDVEEAEHAVEFDKSTCRWRILGPAADVQRSRERQVVMGALREATEPVPVVRLATLTAMPRQNLDVLLSKMVEAGEITRAGRGIYTLAKGSTPEL